METTETQTAELRFRHLLQKNLEERVEKNPRYSIRSFARLLQINDSSLSQILRGKRQLSSEQMQKKLARLGYEDTEITNNKALPNLPRASFDIDTWVDDALLELMRLPNFTANNKWIASQLAITVAEVNGTLERLEKSGYIDRTQKGWKCLLSSSSNIVESSFTNESLKRYQRLLLEKSMRSLLECPKEERDHTSIVVAMDANDLLEAKTRIKAFRRELMAFLERPEAKPSRVVALQTSFIPLTEIEPGETK